MPRKQPFQDPTPARAMAGKSPLRDPAHRRLVEAEKKEQQNPLKTMPNRLTSPGKGDPAADPEAYADLATGEWDRFEP
ncbi:MAG: hypothetical protein L6E13_06280 [Firmicutes bacterium]|nr:hypothetical protein [Bacillota bacterium]